MNVWSTVRLGDCCEIISGATPSTSVQSYWNGDICWATPKDLGNLSGVFIDDTPRKITEAGIASCGASLLPIGSVLFSSRAPIGHVAINTRPMATNQGFKSMVPRPDLLAASYLCHWLRAHRPYLEGLGNGATFKEVSKATVARIEVPLPPFPEQRRIAAILDQADALRAKRRAALAQLDEIVRENFRELFGDLSSNPKGWPIVEVGSVTTCIVPGRDKPRSFTGDIPWITTAELVHLGKTGVETAKFGLTANEVLEVRARIIPTNSVLMTCVGDLGRVSLAAEPIVANQQLHAFQCSGSLLPIYLSHALSKQGDYMRRMATKTTLPYMNKAVCNSIPITLPPLSLQKRFAELADGALELRRRMLLSNLKLDAFFASIQHRAFTGAL